MADYCWKLFIQVKSWCQCQRWIPSWLARTITYLSAVHAFRSIYQQLRLDQLHSNLLRQYLVLCDSWAACCIDWLEPRHKRASSCKSNNLLLLLPKFMCCPYLVASKFFYRLPKQFLGQNFQRWRKKQWLWSNMVLGYWTSAYHQCHCAFAMAYF